jgi:hypothetical protein
MQPDINLEYNKVYNAEYYILTLPKGMNFSQAGI